MPSKQSAAMSASAKLQTNSACPTDGSGSGPIMAEDLHRLHLKQLPTSLTAVLEPSKELWRGSSERKDPEDGSDYHCVSRKRGAGVLAPPKPSNSGSSECSPSKVVRMQPWQRAREREKDGVRPPKWHSPPTGKSRVQKSGRMPSAGRLGHQRHAPCQCSLLARGKVSQSSNRPRCLPLTQPHVP